MYLSPLNIILVIVLTFAIVLIVQTVRLVIVGRKMMELKGAPDLSVIVTAYNLLTPGWSKVFKTYFNIITDRERKSFVKVATALNSQTQEESDALNAHLDLCIKILDEYIKPHLIEELVLVSNDYNEYKNNAVELVILIERDLHHTCVSRHTNTLLQYTTYNKFNVTEVMDIVRSLTPGLDKIYIESKNNSSKEHIMGQVIVTDRPIDIDTQMSHPILTGDIADVVEYLHNEHPIYHIVLVHGCNCHNNMGSGLAKRIKQLYPAAYVADQNTIAHSRDKLGSLSGAKINNNLSVINLYTQFNYGGGINVDYTAMSKAFTELTTHTMPDYMFLIPNEIGCGLAGGDINIVKPLIEKHFKPHPYYLFDI